MKTLWMTNDLWRKTFRRTYVRRSFAEPEMSLVMEIMRSSNNIRFE